MFRFFVTPAFEKSLGELDPYIQKIMRERLKFLSNVENPLLFAKKLKGHKDKFRFRAGDYRIAFRLDGNSVFLLLVKDRKDIYKYF